MTTHHHSGAVVVGAGLAGLVAAHEIAATGVRVILLEQEGPQSVGGQAFWSFGGLFLVDSPEQRRLGIHDSLELARQDWFGSAGFDRPEDHWPRAWAEAYLDFAAGEKRAWLTSHGMRFFPVVGWAERGDGRAQGHGNSVPRFHVTWGTGPGVVEPFADRLVDHRRAGRVEARFRHRVDGLIVEGDRVVGVRGAVLAADDARRGAPTSREVIDDFELRAPAVVVTSGGIGGNPDLVRQYWPERLGTPPATMISGVPEHVDGRMLGITAAAGGRVINSDRMWHYTEGMINWDPIWPNHGIRILPGPSSLWLDATGRRLPPPYLPGFDTLGTLEHLRRTGHDHSWFVTNHTIVGKEFTFSGSEQNPDLTHRDVRKLLRRLGSGLPAPIEAFRRNGADWVEADDIATLVERMNALSPEPLLDAAAVSEVVQARDAEIGNKFSKDSQVVAIRGARNFLGDRLLRVARPHRLTDPKHGPLMAVRLHVLTRKTLGGLETDLSGRVLGAAGTGPVPGLWAAGEVAGFGGGGMHGYRALEGTFLGGCLFSGRTAGRSVAAELR